jgi:type IV pilus assembly protein PilE
MNTLPSGPSPFRRVTGLRPRNVLGFTLIELMIVVVIVGILVAVAYPSYQNQVRQTRRADGKAALLETAQRLERCFTRFNSYANGGCGIAAELGGGGVTSAEGWYLITDGNPGAATFSLVATPQDAQATDTRCGNLTLTHTGQRTASGTVPDTCW